MGSDSHFSLGSYTNSAHARMQTVPEMDNIAKKKCAALRRTLVDAYHIKAHGANDIINVRHDVSKEQDEHKRRKQLLSKKSTRQQLITTWLGQMQHGEGRIQGTQGYH